MKMDHNIDHYSVLGMSSVKFDCTKLTQAEIKTAYRKKALELHPDTIMRKRKRNSDCSNNNVQANNDIAARTAAFQQLQSSYALLMDKRAREIFDLFWLQSQGEGNLRTESKSRQTDWETDRDRQSPDWDLDSDLVREWLERLKRDQDLNWMDPERRDREIRDRDQRKISKNWNREKTPILQEDFRLILRKTAVIDADVIKYLAYWDKSKILKVSWNKDVLGDYTEVQITDLFRRFGRIEKVMTNKNNALSSRAPKNIGIALVVMVSMESVVAATAADWDYQLPALMVWPLAMLP